MAIQAVPRKTMLRVTAELNKQVTEALRVANENAINWQAVLSSPDTVNVLLPDGTTLTGFSWRKINDLLTALDPDDLSATAAQINTDAQQVATDKAAAEVAKTGAETAKTASETAQGKAETAQAAAESAQTAAVAAQGKAETAQAAAESAQTAAESAAASIDATKLLQKDQNLDDLPDKSAARGHLDVYSKYETYGKAEVYLKTETYSQTEVDAKNTVTNARIGYSLLTVTNPALNSRTVITNPFGNNVPVICSAEFFHATLQKWVSAAWICTPAGQSSGFTASNSEGEGVILRVGNMAYSAATVSSGNNQELVTNYTTLSPVRIHVWKVTA